MKSKEFFDLFFASTGSACPEASGHALRSKLEGRHRKPTASPMSLRRQFGVRYQ
jgi:hypothetical protein